MLAQRLTTGLPNKYFVARIESDEFAILIWGQKNERDAVRIAEGLHQILSDPFILQERNVSLSACAGIRLSALGFERPVDLLRDAQTAMKRAKEKGSSSTTVFDSQMRDRSIARVNLESKLSQAIDNHEFFVKFQPVISLKDSAIYGFESFVRWRPSNTREISASDFIPLAEKTQQIFKIDRFVLHEASRQFTKWQEQYQIGQSLWISVNVSSRHMANEGLTWNLQQILAATGLEPSRLNLEFTEKMLMEESNQTIIVLNQLKEIGVQLSIDDFGKGYTSLSYLRHFPFDYLKLDRAFIFENDWDMANLVIELAHKLNLKVIAEGVENQDQLDHMRNLNCDLAQGNFISTDLNAESAGKMLSQVGIP
jgi:EAL domain-containing protein (putative c-di-GMP-specific phosphodiesterase class I)